MKQENLIYKEAFKQLLFILVLVALGRYSKGFSVALMAVVGCCAALTNRVYLAMSLYLFFPAFVIMNPNILPKVGSLMSLSLRFGPLMIGFCLALVSSRRRGRYRLPFGWLFAYLLWAVVSSIDGYFPMISYFKLTNFGMFLVGIWFGTQNIQSYPKDLFKLRAFMLGLVAFFVFGSLALYPFPGISTLNGLMLATREGVDAEIATLMINEAGGGGLFCGVTYQSQTLAGVVGCCFGWMVCDMLMVEKRMRWQHLVLIGVMPVVIFMTRSRMGLFLLAAFALVIYGYTMRHIRVVSTVRQRIKTVMMLGAVVAVLSVCVLEMTNKTITRWIRKTDDVVNDKRSFTEAVTSSRMGLIEKNLYDFKRNPLLGSGFQVDITHLDTFKKAHGLILSAPIEKGLLPLMVIGETGVVGGVIFLGFLISFCVQCVRKRLMATLTLFWVLFASNIGEATFFSPGGPGGVEWMLTIVGGFVIDMYVLSQQRIVDYSMPMVHARR